MTQQSQALEAAFVEGYRRGMERAALREVQFSEAELTGVQDAAAHYVSSIAALGGTPAKQGEAQLEIIAEAINRARYDTDMWRERGPIELANEDKSAQEYARRLAKAALATLSQHPVAASWPAADAFLRANPLRSDAPRYGGDLVEAIGEKIEALLSEARQGAFISRHQVKAISEIKERIRSALIASPVPVKADGGVTEATHRHVRRGSEYVLLGIGKMQSEHWIDGSIKRMRETTRAPGPNQRACVDMREVAVYRSVDDGSLWVRPRDEFEDGRFVALQQDQRS